MAVTKISRVNVYQLSRYSLSFELIVKSKAFFNYLWELIRLVLLTPIRGSKRRAEQRAYEERLDEAMKRVREGMETEAEG